MFVSLRNPLSFCFPVLLVQPTLVGTEQPDDSDADLVADDHELNYGERSDSNHVFGGTNSVYNDNHVMVSGPESGQVRWIILWSLVLLVRFDRD